MIQPVLQQTPPLTIDSKSDQCFSFIKERLENCRTHHSSCIQGNALSLPKRILFVGKPDEEPTLHDTEYIEGRYAILSYCWGNSKNLLKTTSTSLDTHKNGISLAQLPKTIRDAVDITRELGIDFLWVDSLCILQDSEQDWEVESAKMGEYFKNAHITIAASAAYNAQGGILSARRRITQSVEDEYELVDGTICNIVIQERTHSFTELENLVHDFGPLSKRGWAFQENVLSTRTIHYTDSELVWECCTETVSEDGSTPGGNKHSVLAYNMLNLQPNPGRLWQDMVKNYTRRELTYPSDRLPGIAGIAQMIQSRTGFQYVAGLWKERLLLDLLWSIPWDYYNETPQGLTGWSSRPSYRDSSVTLKGPSWSWASTTAAISFPPSEDNWLHDQCAIIRDVSCKVEGNNQFGEVMQGSLQIVGPWRQMKFICGDPRNPFTYRISTIHEDGEGGMGLKGEKHFTPDSLLIGGNKYGGFFRDPLKLDNIHSDFHQSHEFRLFLEKPVWCLGICKSYGLILRESSIVDGAYTRIGLCNDVGSLLQGAQTQLITII
jgi:hypothetical protein